MRLFISINFDNRARQSILAVQQRLRALGMGRFSGPEHLHLTLAFLGEVPPSRLPEIGRAMDAASAPPLELRFGHVGYFERSEGDIWWIGVEENKALAELQSALVRRLSAQGFRLESRSFSPHITLAREVRLNTPPDRSRLLGVPFAYRADRISLMLSERIGGMLTYTEQYAVRLEK